MITGLNPDIGYRKNVVREKRSMANVIPFLLYRTKFVRGFIPIKHRQLLMIF